MSGLLQHADGIEGVDRRYKGNRKSRIRGLSYLVVLQPYYHLQPICHARGQELVPAGAPFLLRILPRCWYAPLLLRRDLYKSTIGLSHLLSPAIELAKCEKEQDHLRR